MNWTTHALRPLTGVCLLSLALVLNGCKEDDTIAAQPKTSAPAATSVIATSTSAPPKFVTGPDDPSGGHPQPKLQTMKLWVGTNEVNAELAMTWPQIQVGMMRRTNMTEMDGMLFTFPSPGQRAFYMRNTVLPLSCAYIDPEGTILETYDMKPLEETPIQSKSDQVQYVLEMNQGWFERHGVKPGVAVSTERGTFPQTFRRR